MSDPSELDLAAAEIRAGARDLPALVEGLATWLEDTVPTLTRVERRRSGLFDARRRVTRIRCAIDDWSYLLEHDGSDVVTRRARVVRGVTLKTETMPLAGWLAALSAELVARAHTDAQAVAALRDLLI
jgi:hypothetical protein